MCEYVSGPIFFHFTNTFCFLVMWNSYAFVHYATIEEGKIQVQSKISMIWRNFSLARRALEQSNGAMFLNRKLIVQFSTSRFRPQPKESTTNNLSSIEHPKPSQYSHSDMNFDLTGNNMNPQVNESNRFYANEFRPASPPIEQHKINNVKANKSIKNGKSSRTVSVLYVSSSIPGMSNLLDTFANHDGKI